MSDLSPQLLDRYSRQIMLSRMGGDGQNRLQQATVLVVGIGAMGGTTLLYLAGAGVGKLLLMEPQTDKPFAAGHRLLQASCHAGVPAAAIAAETLLQLNPTLQTLPLLAGIRDLEEYVPRCSLVVVTEGTEDIIHKINELTILHGVPLLYGKQVDGWIHVRHLTPASGCLECQITPPLLPLPGGPWLEEENWLELGGGLAGCLLAEEALFYLANLPCSQPHSYLDHHLSSATQAMGMAHGQPGCAICSRPRLRPPLSPVDPSAPQVDDQIDITLEQCPMTFVRVKLKLESMPPGSCLRIRLKGKEPLENIPRTLRQEGYQVSAPSPQADGIYCLDAVKPLVQ